MIQADVDIYDPDLYVRAVPHEAFARLRARTRICWHPEPARTGALQAGTTIASAPRLTQSVALGQLRVDHFF